MQLSEQEIIRREKLAKLREMGIDPYPAALYPVNATSKDIKQHYEEGKKVVISGIDVKANSGESFFCRIAG